MKKDYRIEPLRTLSSTRIRLALSPIANSSHPIQVKRRYIMHVMHRQIGILGAYVDCVTLAEALSERMSSSNRVFHTR